MNKKVAIGIGVGAVALIGGIVYLTMQRRKQEGGQSTNGAGGTTGALPTDQTTDVGVQKSASATTDVVSGGGSETVASGSSIALGENWKDNKSEVVDKWRESKTDIKAVCGNRPLFGKAKKQAWAECVAQYSGFSGFDGGNCYVEVGDNLTDL